MVPVTKIGLIGLGRITELVHLNILMNLPDVELVALAECDPERREEARRRVRFAATFADYRDLLEMPDVEAVVICLPNALHAEVTVAALERGKHVYLEKPLAINLQEAKDVLNAWRRAGVVGMIGFNCRHHPLYKAAKRHIQAGCIGEPVIVRSVMSSASGSPATWKLKRRTGGGVLLDLASHHIDQARFFFDQEVREVFAVLQSQRSEDDTATLQMRMANGLLIQSFFSMNSGVDEDRFEVHGRTGKLAFDRYHSLHLEISRAGEHLSVLKQLSQELRSLIFTRYARGKLLAPTREPSYQAALLHFVEAVRANRPAGPDFWDGYRSLAVIEAAEESAKTGRPQPCCGTEPKQTFPSTGYKSQD